jgi:hypothetical protein
MSPVKYELGFYIPEDDILHVYTLLDGNYMHMLTPWFLDRKRNIPTERPPLVGDI